MIVKNRRKMEKIMTPVFIAVISSCISALKTEKGTTKTIKKSARINRFIINKMTRNAGKFAADALQKLENERLTFVSRTPANNPPVRKAFTIKYTITIMNKPLPKEETILPNPSRSVKTSISIPSASLSVIMLDPNPDLKAPFKGKATIAAIIRVTSHTARIPFHDLNERIAPDLKAKNIFILI